MHLLHIVAVLITLAAAFSYINHRYIGLPASIGLIIMALAFSLLLESLGALGFAMEEHAEGLLAGIDFQQAMQGILGFLLFSGAIHIDLNEMARQRWSILLLATLGVLLSASLIGGLLWLILGAVDIRLSFMYCLIFGALISPTDPIAVLSILVKAGLPKSLEMQIAGEALLNDGMAVVMFLVLTRLVAGGEVPDGGAVSLMFLKEMVGGAASGLALGVTAVLLLKGVREYPVAILVTLALVTGGYGFAENLGISAPIAIVIAGLLVGNHGRYLTMTESVRLQMDTFWDMVDEILTAVLFVLIGLEVLVVDYTSEHLIASLAAIPVVLLARFGSVGLLVGLLRRTQEFSARAVTILTWGGLRGGVSVALALSLPAGHERDLILPITYAVVIFSIIVQGLSIGKFLTRAAHRPTE